MILFSYYNTVKDDNAPYKMVISRSVLMCFLYIKLKY